MRSTHIHADFAVFVDDKDVNFNVIELQAPEFGSVEFWEQSNISIFSHLHGGANNINVIHVHASGITLGMFFNTIGGKINDSCIAMPKPVISPNEEYCSSGSKRLKVFVNGDRIGHPQSYVINDLDKILISFGDENQNQINAQLASITDNACKQSAKC